MRLWSAQASEQKAEIQLCYANAREGTITNTEISMSRRADA